MIEVKVGKPSINLVMERGEDKVVDVLTT